MLLLCAIACGWLVIRWQRACQQRAAVTALWQIDDCDIGYDGGDVFNFTDMIGSLSGDDRQFRLAPVGWAEGIFGKHFIHRCEAVGVGYPHVDEVLPHLGKLPYLRRVVIQHMIHDESELDPAGHCSAMAKIRGCVPGIEPEMVVFDLRIGIPEEADEAVEAAAVSGGETSQDDIFSVGYALIAEELGPWLVRCVTGPRNEWATLRLDRDVITCGEFGQAPPEQTP